MVLFPEVQLIFGWLPTLLKITVSRSNLWPISLLSMRMRLKTTSTKYKEAADRHRRDVHFTVGDLVWAVLTKDMFQP